VELSQTVPLLVWLLWSWTDFRQHQIDLKYLPIAILFSIPHISPLSLLAASPFFIAATIASKISPIFSQGDTAMILTALFTASMFDPLEIFFQGSIIFGIYISAWNKEIIDNRNQWLAPVIAAAHLLSIFI
jgi:hypothetical protein